MIREIKAPIVALKRSRSKMEAASEVHSNLTPIGEALRRYTSRLNHKETLSAKIQATIEITLIEITGT